MADDFKYCFDTVCDNISEFDSGFHVFNEYLINRYDSAVMHYIIEPESETLIGYFSLQSSAVLYEEDNKQGAIPAIELKMFALDKQYQGKGVAPVLLRSILETIEDYATDCIGADIILLYAVPAEGVLMLYKNAEFEQAEGLFATFNTPFADGCIPMYRAL